LLTNEEGAETTLHCAQRPASELSSGGYYERCRLREPSALAQDDDLARALWERSAAWVAAASEG
jgi:hypothetical protein